MILYKTCMLSMLLSKTKSFFKITVTSLQNTRDMNNIGALTDVQPKNKKMSNFMNLKYGFFSGQKKNHFPTICSH